MKATEFVKKYGWKHSKKTVSTHSRQLRILSTWEIDLKKLVDSYELVESYGGLKKARRTLEIRVDRGISNIQAVNSDLGKAIADVEYVHAVATTDDQKVFEAFFMNQPFYLQLKFIHGERLFDFDEGIGYRNLTVQIGYVCWCRGDKEFVI